MIKGLDHLQIALPAGSEDAMRDFYCGLLRCVEVPKPDALMGRGGFWAQAGELQLHFGVDPMFHSATKAHPAFLIADLDGLAARLKAAGVGVTWDRALANVHRCFVNDPVGNRIELIAG